MGKGVSKDASYQQRQKQEDPPGARDTPTCDVTKGLSSKGPFTSQLAVERRPPTTEGLGVTYALFPGSRLQYHPAGRQDAVTEGLSAIQRLPAAGCTANPV